MLGWQLIAFLNDDPLECISFSNGRHGCADIVGDNGQTVLVCGHIKTYLCIPYDKGQMPPKVEVFISDVELNETKI